MLDVWGLLVRNLDRTNKIHIGTIKHNRIYASELTKYLNPTRSGKKSYLNQKKWTKMNRTWIGLEAIILGINFHQQTLWQSNIYLEYTRMDTHVHNLNIKYLFLSAICWCHTTWNYSGIRKLTYKTFLVRAILFWFCICFTEHVSFY